MFESILAILFSGVISGLIVLIGGHFIIKKYTNTDVLLDISEELLDEIATNKPLQERLFLLGAIIGKGVRSGVGMGGKGKFKIEDVLAMLFEQGLPESQRKFSANQISNNNKAKI